MLFLIIIVQNLLNLSMEDAWLPTTLAVICLVTMVKKVSRNILYTLNTIPEHNLLNFHIKSHVNDLFLSYFTK